MMKAVSVASVICCLLPLSVKAGLWSDYMRQDQEMSSNAAEAVFSPDNAFVLPPHELEQRARKLATAVFKPLTCNAVYSACTKWTESRSEYTTPSGWVLIPCGKCVTMDITDGRMATIAGGLQIQGKLVVPTTARVTLAMTTLIVEGELQITSTDVITGTPKVTFHIQDSATTPSFTPHLQNINACGGSSCQLGKQAIVVAGGKLTIQGMPDNCPAWATVQGVKSGEMATTTSNAATIGTNGTLSSVVPDGCDPQGTIVSQDFSKGMGDWVGELGTVAQTVTTKDDMPYLSITSRAATWQGAHYILPDSNLKCLQPNIPYMFTAKVRLTGANSKPSLCSNGKTSSTDLAKCPKLRLNYIDGSNVNIWRVLSNIGSAQVKPDGQWMNLTSSVIFTKVELASTNLYLKLTIDGPEGNVDMDVADILLTSPIAAMASAGPSTCENLIVNGGAEAGVTYPWTTFVTTDPQPTVQTEGTNKFFTQTQRQYAYSSIAMSLNPECIVAGSTYAFSSQLRVHSASPSTFRVVLKAIQADGSGTQVPIASCQPGPTTWTTCASSYTFSDSDASAVSVQIYFYGVTDSTSDVDYDAISFTFLTAGGSRAILPTSVTSCWGVNASVAVPSESLTYDGGMTTTISSLDKSSGALSVTTPFPMPCTKSSNPDYAGQIALLSRNILFKGDDGLPAGPHLIIYRTPGVAQLIDGVAFSGFGRPGEAQRFPINFYMSGDASGSTVSRNAITNSKQRCIVLSGTSSVSVSGNVAYDTAGHCYVLEQGTEKGNVFDGNFGALQTAPTSTISGATDENPSTFYITAPDNTFTNNVAAGSYGHGYWLNIPITVTGESAITNVGYSPAVIALKSFTGNVAHSNRFYGLNQATGYTPASPSIIRNFRSYRNNLGGAYFWNAKNIQFDGALIADNKIGFNLNYLNGLEIKNSKVIGYSSAYQKEVASNSYPSHCYGTSTALYGIELFVNGMDPSWDGNLVSNVSFANLTDATGCLGSKAIVFNPLSKTKSFDATTSLENLSFDKSFSDASSSKLSLCDVDNSGVTNVMISDDGSLFPDIGSGGIVVSENSTLLDSLQDCVDVPGSCSKYCELKIGSRNACMRQVTVAVGHDAADGLFLIVTGEGQTLNISGSFTPTNPLVDSLWTSRTYFTVSLGKGRYTGTFVDSAGNETWPIGAAVTFGSIPSCIGYFDSFNISVPKPSEGKCHDLIKNSDFETDSIGSSGWSHTGSGIHYQTPGYPGAGTAVQTDGRTAVSQGPAVFLDTRCLKTAGAKYLLSAMVYLVDSSTGEDQYCDAADRIGPYRCPRANLATFKGTNMTSFQFDAANAVGPWTNSTWNAIRGPIKVDAAVVAADFVAIYFDNLRVGVEMRIDEVHLTPFNVACPTTLNLVKNGDFAKGTYEFWWYYGSTTKLQIVTPGYMPERQYALSTVQRDSPTVGLTQEMNPECFQQDQLYVINLHFQLETYEGEKFVCDPYASDATTCPSASLQVTKGTDVSWVEIGKTVGPISNFSDWALITGVFNATDKITTADDLQLLINGAWSGYNLIIDAVDISMAKLVSEEQAGVSKSVISQGECYNIAQNGDFSIGDARFWDVSGPGTQLEMYAYKGKSSPALKVTGRSVSFAGAKQTVNQACLVEGVSWTVQAKFKLMEGSDEVGCDSQATWGDNQCPGITLTASKRDASGTMNTKVLTLRNMVNRTWDAADFNDFHAAFTVTNEMSNWDSFTLSTDLTRPGVDVIFDDLRIIKSLGV